MPRDENNNVALTLAKKIKLTHDSYIFRFSFPDPEWTFGSPIGDYVKMSATTPTKEHPQGELITRTYTPISDMFNKGYVDFAIKIYRKGQHPKFPDGGIMS